MPPIQEYNIYTKKGYAGELCDSGPRVAQSEVAGEAILFGLAVQRSGGVVTAGTVTGNVFGIAMREYNREADLRPSDGSTSYKDADTVSVFRQGYLYVELTGAVSITAGQAVHVNDVTGAFTKAAVAGDIVACTNITADEDLIITGGTDILRIRMDIVA